MKNVFKRPFFNLRRRKGRFGAGNILFIITFVVLVAYVALLLWLMVWGLLTSVKDFYDDFGLGNVAGFPKKFTFEN